MAWTYGDPGASAKDAVRFAVGDTDERRPQLQDAEIIYCLRLTGGDIDAAAVRACESIITQLGRLCDQTVGSVSKSFSQLQGNYKETLANLRRTASSSGGVPLVGGISKIENRAPYGNRDYNPPQFTTRMFSRRSRSGLPHLGSLTASQETEAPDDRDGDGDWGP